MVHRFETSRRHGYAWPHGMCLVNTYDLITYAFRPGAVAVAHGLRWPAWRLAWRLAVGTSKPERTRREIAETEEEARTQWRPSCDGPRIAAWPASRTRSTNSSKTSGPA